MTLPSISKQNKFGVWFFFVKYFYFMLLVALRGSIFFYLYFYIYLVIMLNFAVLMMMIYFPFNIIQLNQF
jgi:hypothetical protein